MEMPEALTMSSAYHKPPHDNNNYMSDAAARKLVQAQFATCVCISLPETSLMVKYNSGLYKLSVKQIMLKI